MHTGSCLCGGVKIRVEDEFEHAPEACHCHQCRKQSGSFLTAVNVRKSKLSVEGEDLLSWYASSEKVDRGFCKVCGSTLFWAPNMEDYDWIAVALGLFDGPTGLTLAKHTFVNDKGDYYALSDGVPQSDSF